jgi:hypothetical protein
VTVVLSDPVPENAEINCTALASLRDQLRSGLITKEIRKRKHLQRSVSRLGHNFSKTIGRQEKLLLKTNHSFGQDVMTIVRCRRGF